MLEGLCEQTDVRCSEIGESDIVETDPVGSIFVVELQTDRKISVGYDSSYGLVLIITFAESDGCLSFAVGIAVGGAVDVHAIVCIFRRQRCRKLRQKIGFGTIDIVFGALYIVASPHLFNEIVTVVVNAKAVVALYS